MALLCLKRSTTTWKIAILASVKVSIMPMSMLTRSVKSASSKPTRVPVKNISEEPIMQSMKIAL